MPQDAPGPMSVPKTRIDHPGDSAVRYVKHIGRRFKNGFREVTPCVTDLTERGSF